jgi:hypothetical protein
MAVEAQLFLNVLEMLCLRESDGGAASSLTGAGSLCAITGGGAKLALLGHGLEPERPSA